MEQHLEYLVSTLTQLEEIDVVTEHAQVIGKTVIHALKRALRLNGQLCGMMALGFRQPSKPVPQ
tara:strand:+ start:777 stop:968 length:192 start_codon:yes stop_codon:yes gene_type:complete